MTEKKKRGLLSWLGFGDEEQTKQSTEQQTETEPTLEQTVDEQLEHPEAELAEAECRIAAPKRAHPFLPYQSNMMP